MAHAAESAEAGVVLMACTSMGKDLAARVAAKLDAGLLSDVVELEDADGRLRAKRPVYSGKALATVAVPAGRRAMAMAFSSISSCWLSATACSICLYSSHSDFWTIFFGTWPGSRFRSGVGFNPCQKRTRRFNSWSDT